MGSCSTCGIFAFVLIAGLFSSHVQATDVPVFVWGKPSVTYVPALSKYTNSEFAALVESQASGDTFIVLFAEDQLSTEDFTQCKLNTNTCFRNLAKVERKSYLPSVEEPLAIFDGELGGKVESVQLADDGSLSKDIVPKGGHTVIINLSGTDYATHDTLMNNLYNKLHGEFPNILSIYTAKTSSFKYSNLIRRTRQVTEAPPTQRNVLNVTNFIIAYEKFSAGPTDALAVVTLDQISKNDENSTENKLQIDLQGPGAKLSLSFQLTQGSWEVTGVTYDNAQYYMRYRIHLNQYFSFHCNNLEYYTPDGKKKIVFEEIQMQPNWPEEGREFKQFGDAWDCVGFTSPAILTGLFLVVIFIFIGGFGITWMMDMRTMDRFDDPKGKTITVTTAD